MYLFIYALSVAAFCGQQRVLRSG